MTDPTAPTPQDAGNTQAVPSSPTQHLPVEGPGSVAWSPPPVPPATPAPATPPAPATAPKPHVTYLPPPAGPNWGLVLIGVIFGLVGAGVVANQLTGFQVSSLSEMGPSVLVIGGLACALLGMVGILTRRRRG